MNTIVGSGHSGGCDIEDIMARGRGLLQEEGDGVPSRRDIFAARE